MPNLLTIEPISQQTVQSVSFLNTQTLILNIDVKPASGEIYVSYSDCKRIIAGKFTSVKQYKDYVRTHELDKQGLPLNPWNAYYGIYEGAEKFLGGSASSMSKNTEKRSRARYQNYLENLKKDPSTTHYARRKNSQENQVAPVVRKKQTVSKEIVPVKTKEPNVSMFDICKFLASKNMADVLKVICEHKSMNLSDARTITTFLVDHYTK